MQRQPPPQPSQTANQPASSFPRPQSTTAWFMLGATTFGLACLCLAVVVLGIVAYPQINITRSEPESPQAAAPPASVSPDPEGVPDEVEEPEPAGEPGVVEAPEPAAEEPESVDAPEGGGETAPGDTPEPAPDETPAQDEPPVQVEAPGPASPQTILAAADGQPVSDDHGTRLSVPVGALEDGQPVHLVASQLSQDLVEDLSEAHSVASPAYQVTAGGDQDGVGRARLELPAPDPETRLAALIDDHYLAVLDVAPENGYFTIMAHLGAPEAASEYPPSGADAQPVTYFTLTPWQAAPWQGAPTGHSGHPWQGARTGPPKGRLAPLLEDPGDAACSAWGRNHCRRNAASSVYAVWGEDYPDSLKDTEYLRIVDTLHAVELVMKTYQAFGFSAAAIGPSNPVHLRVSKDVDTPNYDPRNGVLYLPWDLVADPNSPANQRQLAHELFHWIEDEEYRMITAYYSHAGSWWLEMAAEYATFLIDPANLQLNLTEYGITTVPQGMLGFQSSPLIWDGKTEESRYIQAQLLYPSICSDTSVCALSDEDFVQAINAGSYPFDSGDALARYRNNLKDAGLYLLGSPPQGSRTGAALSPALANGTGYGDRVLVRSVSSVRDPSARFETTGATSQFSQPEPGQVKVVAPIQQGGVYPFRVVSGQPAPLPTYLHIDPGPAFWLRLDGQPPVFYPAGTELDVAPISEQLGYGQARVVGIAPDTDQTFQARVGFIDLAGDWLAKHTQVKLAELDCPGGVVNEAEVSERLREDEVLAIFGGLGTYVLDPTTPDGSRLIWEQNLPLEELGIESSVMALESEINLKPEAIVLEYRLVIFGSDSLSKWLPSRAAPGSPSETATSSLWMVPLMLTLGAVAGTARKRRWALYLLVIILLGAGLLAACVGLSIQGTIEGTYTFKQVELIDPAANPYGDSRYVWRLHDGKGQIEVDLTSEASVSDLDGNVTTEASRCQAKIQSQVEAFVGADGLAPLPSFE